MANQKSDAGPFDDVGFLIFGERERAQWPASHGALAAMAELSEKGNGWPNFRLSEGGNTEKHR
jgi:hypothetical protein